MQRYLIAILILLLLTGNLYTTAQWFIAWNKYKLYNAYYKAARSHAEAIYRTFGKPARLAYKCKRRIEP